ncbi:hypothetical protein CUJ83_06935 [Methanocella sp. CWC-04]|uniref:Thioredoxin domain-containing protein n=1 Tax=Methanooceanicella nereidis TaxID=2052831 RepID=A0AAP2W605_9EURY|nr:thioredoxin family protein [Methanocella sp. CWC-04]MCD1294732.1 hypothetical protein [Methanocella sp. CWC-04]
MRLRAKMIIPMIILILTISFSSGCICQQLSPESTAPVEGSLMKELSSAEDIDAALETGPVFLEFGNDGCYWCRLQKPIAEQLSIEYDGISFLYIDTSVHRALVAEYNVNPIPHMNLIVKKNPDGSYLYVDEAGNLTENRDSSKILGLHQKDQLVKLLDTALSARAA